MSRRRRHRSNRLYRPQQAKAPSQVPRPPGKRAQRSAAVVGTLCLMLLAAGVIWARLRAGQPARTRAEVQPSVVTTQPTVPLSARVEPMASNTISLMDPPADSTNGPTRDRMVAGLNKQANRLMNAGDASQAIELYRKALTLTPDDEDLHYNLGIAYAKLGDLARAE